MQLQCKNISYKLNEYREIVMLIKSSFPKDMVQELFQNSKGNLKEKTLS